MLTRKDQFILPLAHFFAPFLLFVLSLLLFYAGWPLIPEMLILVIPGILLYIYYERKNQTVKSVLISLKGASWLIFYFAGLCAVVYFGNHANVSMNALSTTGSVVCLAIVTLMTYFYGAFYAWDKEVYIPMHEREMVAKPKDSVVE